VCTDADEAEKFLDVGQVKGAFCSPLPPAPSEKDL
jgi:hypothetical protein